MVNSNAAHDFRILLPDGQHMILERNAKCSGNVHRESAGRQKSLA